MKNLFFSMAALLLFPVAGYSAPDKYAFDKDHTHIVFFVNHEGFSDMIGRFKSIDGYFTFSEQEPEKSVVDVTIKTASVDTDVTALNKVLLSKQFFNVSQFPEMHFKSTNVEIATPGTAGLRAELHPMADVTGNLTLLGVTKPLTLHVTYNKSGIHPLTNNYISGFTARGTLNRSDYGMNAYPKDIGNSISFIIEAEGIDPLRHPGNTLTPH